MISLDVKTETKSSSSLGLSSSTEEEPKISFSSLLKGVSDKKDDTIIQNGALVLSLGSDEKELKDTKTLSKRDILLALLKNEKTKSGEEIEITLDKDENSKESVVLNPKISANLTPKELKNLVSDAKEFLKSKILQSDDYKKLQTKELPKTLKGLAQMAKIVGIDVSKITMEEIQASSIKKDLTPKTTLKAEIPHAKAEVKAEIPHAKVEVKAENPHAKVEVKAEIPHAKAEIPHAKVEVKTEKVLQENEEIVQLRNEDKKIDIVKEVKATPLFKAQQSSEHTTEQLVQTKQFKVNEKTPKSRADETLKLLLMGEKPSQNNSALTVDFSVTTAKVIAPQATTDTSKALEKLLHSKRSESENSASSKIDGITVHKADSFEVKLNEAKQMIKYLSTDVKTAIEDYKSPFTRIKIQLNPAKLGDVDLTIVQRGKNLHVNLSSNTTAINTLSMNANELKTQLNNSGINNATLNFSNGSDNANQNQQQGQRQHEREAHEEYGRLGQFDNEETNEEVLSSLEIVVPRYG